MTTKMRQRPCKECGTPLTSHKVEAEFCAPRCRQAFHNRRLQRGAQLYDLFMSWRYNRDLASLLGIWPIMARLASNWRSQDKIERSGRESWQDPRRVIEQNPWVRHK